MTTEDIMLQWKEYGRSLSTTFKDLREDNALVDCTVAAEGQYLQAHRLVLSACSPYFQLLFKATEGKHPIVVLKDMKFGELKALIDFMYSGEVIISQEQLESFLKAAECLQVKQLVGASSTNDLRDRDLINSPQDPALLSLRKKRRALQDDVQQNAFQWVRHRGSNQKSPTNEQGSGSFLGSMTSPFTEATAASSGTNLLSSTPYLALLPREDALLTVKQEPVDAMQDEFGGQSVDSGNKVTSENCEEEQTVVVKVEPTEYMDENFEEKCVEEEADCSMKQKTQDVRDAAGVSLASDPSCAEICLPEDKCKDEITVDDNMEGILQTDGIAESSTAGSVAQSSAEVGVSAAIINMEMMDIPLDIIDEEEAVKILIPQRSKELYEREYEKFSAWRNEKYISTTNETVMLAYISEQSKVLKPSSLWCLYSKLKTMLSVKEKVNVSSFNTVVAFLKKCSVGYEGKKSDVLSRSQFYDFLLKAPNDIYLFMKVVTVFGICGACKCQELYNLCVDDVRQEGSILIVCIRDAKTYTSRTFTIIPDGGPINFVALYEKYLALRPKHVKCKNLFLNYRDNKCSCQPVGINTLGKIPMEIAKFLKLPNPSVYTGHCFRRSSANILTNNRASILRP